MFDKVSDSNETFKIWSDVSQMRLELYAKVGTVENIVLRPLHIMGSRLVCSPENPIPLSPSARYELVAQFTAGSDKYFFQGYCHFENENVSIEINAPLYRLQRRQAYRVRIPPQYAAHLVAKEKIPLYDLSSGGCCLHYPKAQTPFKTGDLVQATLHLGQRDELLIQGVVRHIRLDPNSPTKSLVGIQFEAVSPALETQLVNVMMELSRYYLRS